MKDRFTMTAFDKEMKKVIESNDKLTKIRANENFGDQEVREKLILTIMKDTEFQDIFRVVSQVHGKEKAQEMSYKTLQRVFGKRHGRALYFEALRENDVKKVALGETYLPDIATSNLKL
ncbi:uncharacterized protein PHALS_13550 [Plasmopara halstedii]|uniref:Uncharacterized protein n=1 Tax=Plasmopara halstedii TaxID=4781 RepID=A0A0P1AP78_PLAHL|nr:uncharacterized protein PHALS_13550 [Plasmopara halstedii]CEG43350.1 hypothetical protein PHALS_13550 [Plasmopara halstedii]|eukprot:XP_024579719.1 hypothetical protein PHALS_13550 [Plasmopara halstedii]